MKQKRKDKLYISDGNIRMKIPTFSLPTGKTCRGKTEHCEKFCYAKKAEVCYKGVVISRDNNFRLSKKRNFTIEMCKIIARKKGKYIRIHESGDFYNQKYLNKWIEICKIFPNKKFLAYTQSYDLDFSKKPKNLVVYYSVWDDSKNVPKKGLYAYAIDNGNGKLATYKIPKTHLCKKSATLTCDECLFCYEGMGNVSFKLH